LPLLALLHPPEYMLSIFVHAPRSPGPGHPQGEHKK